MPSLTVRIPQGAFPGRHRQELVRALHRAALSAEQIPEDPARRGICWIAFDEVAPGAWTCDGVDVGARLLPCFLEVAVPAGVLDDTSRASYVRDLHAAFESAKPSSDTRTLATSVRLVDVPDGTWGVGGQLWRLPDFTRASGYRHLRHLVDR